MSNGPKDQSSHPGVNVPPPPPQAPTPQWGDWSGAQQPQWGQHAQQPQWGQPPAWGAPAPRGPGGYAAPPKPGIIPLRPLGLGEILDGAFQAARKNAPAMFGSALLFQAAVVALMAAVTGLTFGAGSNIESFLAPDGMPTTAGLTFGLGLLAVLILFSLLNVASVMVLQGALVLPVSRAVLNQHTGFRQMWSLVRGRIWPLLGLCLLVLAAATIAVILVLVLCIVFIEATNLDAWLLVVPVLASTAAFVWIAVKISLAPAALVLERSSITGSIARSWRLVHRHWWRTFGILALATIIVAIVTSVVTVPIQVIVSVIGTLGVDGGSTEDLVLMTIVTTGISTLISSLFAAIGYAFQAGVTALLYVDLRMRGEGFDVVLMKEVEYTAPPYPGLPYPGPGR